jgi:hypothetical protein
MASRSPKIEHRKALLDQARIYTYSPERRLEGARSGTGPGENSPLFSDVFFRIISAKSTRERENPRSLIDFTGAAKGIRTRVFAMKGRSVRTDYNVGGRIFLEFYFVLLSRARLFSSIPST